MFVVISVRPRDPFLALTLGKTEVDRGGRLKLSCRFRGFVVGDPRGGRGRRASFGGSEGPVWGFRELSFGAFTLGTIRLPSRALLKRKKGKTRASYTNRDDGWGVEVSGEGRWVELPASSPSRVVSFPITRDFGAVKRATPSKSCVVGLLVYVLISSFFRGER